MAIAVGFFSRYAIPLIVAALYLGDVDIPQQMEIYDKMERLTDMTLSIARKEGEGTERYDYIIVGAGSAGALLANKLTASGENRVLLLEAGGDPNPFMEIPYSQRFFWDGEVNNWNYTTVKQTKSCQRTDGHCQWPRGKALGGSSSVNGLVYNRCKPKDYDYWANFTGDQSWSWQNVLEAFNSIEDYHGFHEETAGATHGHGGDFHVGKIDYIPGVEIFEEALQEKGFPTGGDLNGGEAYTYGFGKVDYNIKDGLRVGTFQAYLEPILNRTNLVIYRHAYATKVLTEESVNGNLRALGVTYQRHGVIRTALAGKEVIISAGTVESPKLLMLSGIGPKEHLEELGILPILDLPVGKYMQEHPGIEIVGENGGFVLNTTFAKDHNTTENVLQFITNGTGPLNAFRYESGYAAQLLMGYFNTSFNDDKSWPEIHTYVIQQYHPATDRQEFYFSLELVRSTTTGSIKLASKDPDVKPVIDPNFFEDPTDVERMVDGIEVMMDVYLNTTTFQRYGIQPQGPYKPCEAIEYGTRDYWRCVVTHKAGPYFHPTSTCRMGPNSTVAVLDSKLKVFGTENLRVIDASAMPFAPSGNTALPAMLIGARGAEIILSGE